MNTPSHSAGDQVCAHEGCTCTVDEVSAVTKNGDAYCSEECAEGQGCHHSDCECGNNA